MKFMFGLQHPLTCKPWTTLSNPCNKVRGKYNCKEVYLLRSFLHLCQCVFIVVSLWCCMNMYMYISAWIRRWLYNNIPYYEACKLVVGSKTSTYSQAVQHNKSPYNKYETIVKILIQLEPGDWESFINKIKALLDTTRATGTPTTSVDLVENKEESFAQTQTQLGKTDTEVKTAITPTTRQIKHPVTRSSTKIRSKDKRSPIWPLASTDSSSNKKEHLHKQNPTLKPKIQETENTETMNQFRILQKMKTEINPQLTKPKTQKNKPTNNLEQRNEWMNPEITLWNCLD